MTNIKEQALYRQKNKMVQQLLKELDSEHLEQLFDFLDIKSLYYISELLSHPNSIPVFAVQLDSICKMAQYGKRPITLNDLRNILNKVGITGGTKGYEYVKYIIIESLTNDMDLFDISSCYKTVGEVFNTTPSSIERMIRYIISKNWYDIDYETSEEIFGEVLTNIGRHPANNQFILALTDYILTNFELDMEIFNNVNSHYKTKVLKKD